MASFLTGGVLKCDIAHRRSVADLSMLINFSTNRLCTVNRLRSQRTPTPYKIKVI